MTPISILIRNLESLTKKPAENPFLQQVRVVFLSPTLHIDLISDAFRGWNDDDRLASVNAALVKHCNDETVLLSDIVSKLPVTISPLTSDEAENKAKWLGAASTSSWVNWFVHSKLPTPRRNIPSAPRYVHFYGYKGGQARSSVLALFGKLLADDGYKVLLIDADTEAPSLDSLLGAHADRFSQTLMGLCGWSDDFQPVPATYTSPFSRGRVDVLPCRPRTKDHDLDFALLVATAPLDTRIYERAAYKLRSALSVMEEPYDFVLIDHRTGIATSVLPLVGELPGPTVVFIRADSNTVSMPSEMKKVVRAIFENSGDNAGAFVSFSLDANRKSEGGIPGFEARVRTELLETLAQSLSHNAANRISERVSDEEEELSPQELELNWIDWYFDRALLDSNLPDVSKLQNDNIQSLRKLRDVLGLPINKKAHGRQNTPQSEQAGNLSLSGARDMGTFIHIPDVERLFVKGSPITYVLGRKGTGKTRLLRELALRHAGTPVLVAADETSFPALQSKSTEAQAWLGNAGTPKIFWWSLIRLALEEATPLPETIINILKAGKKPVDFADPLQIKSLLLKSKEQKVFLIDGLETLVPASQSKGFVAELFTVMSTIQNDPALSSKLVIRAFLREDLSSDSVQNIEQQMEGRVLRLKWSESSILNFAVSRLPSLPWISKKFSHVMADINQRTDEIQRSALSEQDATELLLRIFPDRLRRNNLLTSTFLRLYFSDAGGDNTNMATFYPRLYLYFLQKLDELAQADKEPLSSEDDRLNSGLLNRAYDQASTVFIEETKQELVHLLSLNLASNEIANGDNQSHVAQFVAAFDGISTPFVLDKLVVQLKDKTQFTEQSIRESLQRMKNLRMFEERPGYPGSWRVGQLYKMGLRMKYARRTTEEIT